MRETMREAMRAALLVFGKDVRRFRIPLGAYLGMMALYGWMDAVLPRRSELGAFSLPCEILLLLAAWYLSVMAVHHEALPGDNQYWLTRPISWQSVLAAKTVFVVVFVHLPVLLANVAALLANGLSPFAYVVPLIAKQWFLTTFLVLPAMAAASVTRNFGQFAIWVFAGFGAVLLIGLELQGISLGRPWGGLSWMIESAVSVVSLLGLTGLLLWQYSQRRTIVAQAILGAVVLVCATLPSLNFWHAAFVVQSRYDPPGTGAAAIHLSLDANRDLAPGRGALANHHRPESLVRILLPVQITGIPTGMEILSERIAVTAETPDGASWSSGWTDYGGTLRPTGDNWLLLEDGPYWQYLYIDRAFYDGAGKAPLHLRTTAAFTLLSTGRIERLTPPAFALVPEFGFCRARLGSGQLSNNIGGSVSVICLAPFQHGWVLARMQSRRTRQFENSGQRDYYSPYPTEFTAGVWTAFGAGMLVAHPSDLDVVLEARHAEAHFERGLDLRGIRLAQYLDTPPGARR